MFRRSGLSHRETYFPFCHAVKVAVLSALLGVWSFTCVYGQEQTSGPEKLSTSAEKPPSSAHGPEQDGQDELYPMLRSEWFRLQRAYPFAHIPKGVYWKALEQKRFLLAKSAAFAGGSTAAGADPFGSVAWTADGPQPAAAYYGPTPYSGRATSIAVHPSDPLTVYVGTAAGGVWKTTDGGSNWTPLTDNQASLAIGAVTIDPNNPNTVFAGTGEPNFSVDSYFGQGLLKSTDAGATWTLIRTPFTTGDTVADFTQIAVQPGNSKIVLAANLAGLYRSADGGTTWDNVISPGGYAGLSSVLFDVKTPTIAYAGAGGFYPSGTGTVYMSTDSGQTWTTVNGTGTTILPGPTAVIRSSLVEDSTGTTLYAALANSNFSGPGTLYSTTNKGLTWTKLTSPDGLDWYRNAIAVSPTNSQVLFATGAGLFQSTDGGQTWVQNNSSPIYADQHAFAFSGDGSRMYLADDGGVFVTTAPNTANASFNSLNTTLNTMTFYPGFSLIAGQANTLLAGSQDHGLNLYRGNLSWPNGEQSGFCGDGGSTYIDPKGQYAYAHCQGGPANWVANSTGDSLTGNWIAAQSGINAGKTDREPWVADIKGDQNTTSIVYTATNLLYQSTNNAASWTAISPDLTAGKATINTIGISPNDSQTIYTGASDGTVSVTTNAISGASATWTTLKGLPNASISKIVVSPSSAKSVYVADSAFDVGHIFHSTDGGSTWTDISANLPNTPVNSILLDPSLLNTIYLATDTGVYYTRDAGASWSPLGQGLPNVVVQDLLMDPGARALRVITHGRGAWDAVVPLIGLQSSQTALKFLDQPRNTTSAPLAVTLTNNLSQSLNVTGIQTAGPFAQTNTCGTSLAPGASCTVSVTFSPTATGPFTGSVTASSSTNVIQVGLSGVGIGIPQATLDVSSLTFASQPIAVASASQTVQLSNPGDASLTGIAITVAGSNATDFSQTNTCGASLASGASCTITAIFIPSSTGTSLASLAIADNAVGSPQSIGLTGTGIAPYSLSATATAVSVAPGATATYALSLAAVAGNPLASTVQLTCAGYPASSSCTLTPSTVVAGSLTQNISLIVATTPGPQPVHAGILFLGAVTLFVLLLRSRRRTLLFCVLMGTVFVTLSGCGKTTTGPISPINPGTPAGSYTVTVTAAQSTKYQTSLTLTLVVQ